jgi:hypothetical protein
LNIDQLFSSLVVLRSVVNVAAEIAIYGRVYPDVFVVQEREQVTAVSGVVENVAASCFSTDTSSCEINSPAG